MIDLKELRERVEAGLSTKVSQEGMLELLSILESAQKASAWQPIETAPKTNSSILVWCPELRNKHVVTWDDRYGGEWRIFGAGNYLNEQPTHWMPLPPAPASL